MNKNFDFLKQHFDTDFPISECINQNDNESTVHDGSNCHICLIVNHKFDEQIEIRILKPYIAADVHNENNGQVFYGWTDEWGNIYDDFQRPIHYGNWQVIGYKKI